MKSKPLWVKILLALAAAVVAFATYMTTGCSVAIQGQLSSWAATERSQPPDIPEWGKPFVEVEELAPATKPSP